MHQGQCLAPCIWILQVAAAPVHHDLHPQPKIKAQKLMESAAVGTAANANIRVLGGRNGSEDIGAIINRRNPDPPGGV